jgi:hypothetical protein
MPISQFTEKLITRLKIDPIHEPEKIINENLFERNFVTPITFEIKKTEPDVFLFSHPWGGKAHCIPNCQSAREGKGHIQEYCDRCWKGSKDWGTVNAFGTKNNFDLVAMDVDNEKLAIEIKFLSFTKGRKPNGEIQRLIGQCALAASKFNFVIGVCGYVGKVEPKYDVDTEKFVSWSEKNNIYIVFRSILK